MGNISFVKTQDGYIARQKSSIDASRIRTDPRFARTRENIAEFGRAGKASKLLRKALRVPILHCADPRATSRLTREFVKVIQADITNPRGKRNVIDGEAELLTGFEFNVGTRLESTLVAPYTVTINRATGSTSVQIPAFDPATLIVAPVGATHARIAAASAVVNFETEKLTAHVTTSANIALDAAEQPALDLVSNLGANSTSPIFVAVSIEFFQDVNGLKAPLNDHSFNALSIVQVDGGV